MSEGPAKRKYIKRDCTYWGHDYKFTGTVMGGNGREMGWCHTCTRCRTSVVDKGCTSRNITHLIGVTLKDLPKPFFELGQSYKIMDVYKNEKQKTTTR